jgi:hypothetical protein
VINAVLPLRLSPSRPDADDGQRHGSPVN